MSDLRVIPSIEQLRQRDAMRALETRYGREALLDALRAETAGLRQRLASGEVAAGTVRRAVPGNEIRAGGPRPAGLRPPPLPATHPPRRAGRPHLRRAPPPAGPPGP